MTGVELPDFSRASVLVIGDVILDRFWSGDAFMIAEEAPVPIIRFKGSEDRPGGSANVALNIAALGASVTLVGVTGKDEAADTLTSLLEKAGVKVRFQRVEGQKTLVKMRVISMNQLVLRVDFVDEPLECDIDALIDEVSELLEGVKVMVMSDAGHGTLKNHRGLIKAARERGVIVLADPSGVNCKDLSVYTRATMITPNVSELEAAVGRCADEEDMKTKATKTMHDLKLDSLLVTRDANGLTLLRPDQNPLDLPALATKVVDVNGAGDTLLGALAASVAAGQEMMDALKVANIAAGVAVGKSGTAIVSRSELYQATLDAGGSTGRGVLDLDQLKMRCEIARESKEKIVFTNGCFDILHEGHVRYLEEARAKGRHLIVAVNDDDSVRRLKGEGRPVTPLRQRMNVLAGLGAVDWVTSFSEDTPEELLRAVKPDTLVKGGDYGIDEVVGADIVQGYGGEVFVLGLAEGLSTTKVIEHINGDS